MSYFSINLSKFLETENLDWCLFQQYFPLKLKWNKLQLELNFFFTLQLKEI